MVKTTDLKILLVDQYNKIGGGQSVLIDLINSFERSGLQCTVAVPPGGYIESQVSDVQFHYLPVLKLNNGKKSPGDLLRIIMHYLGITNIIKKVRLNDIVYVNGPRYFIFFYLLSFFVRRKFIYHVHLDHSGAGKFILKLLFKHSNTFALVFTSNFLLGKFLRQINSGPEDTSPKLHVLEPGLGKKYEQLPFKDRYSDRKAPFNFISVGRIYPGKGFDLIITIAKHYTAHHFYIVGDPVEDALDHYKSLKETAPANVHFIPGTANIPALVNDLDIQFAIVPSDLEEAFGIVATELMMCSCITFVRDRGGLKEISVNTGAILFEDRDTLIACIDGVLALSDRSKADIALDLYNNTQTLYNSTLFTQKLRKILSE